MVSRNLLSFMDDETLENRLAAAAAAGGKRKSWDDEFVLKRQFAALIPAFDPRPGRTNVNQTSDLDIPVPGSLADAAYSASGLSCGYGATPVQPALSLTLRGPHLGGNGGGGAAAMVAGLSAAGAGPSTSGVSAAAAPTAAVTSAVSAGGDVEITLHNPEWTIFRAVQELMQASTTMNKQDKMRKVRFFIRVISIAVASCHANRLACVLQIWEPTFTIVYKEQPVEPVHKMLAAARRPDTDTNDNDSSEDDGGKSTPVIHSGRASTTLSPSSPVLTGSNPPGQLATAVGTSAHTPSAQCTVDDVLSLLSQLNAINAKTGSVAAAAGDDDDNTDGDANATHLAADLFMSKKITNKLQQQIQDPLVLSSNSLPAWCEDLNQSCPFLFPFETRQLYFNCTAFGASRSIVWLQSQRDVTLERQRMPGLSPRRTDDQHEFRVGRLKHERVKVARSDRLLEWAMQVMRVHCNRKSVLEVEFLGEEGTGLGPTLEFYALVAAELQRADLAMWLCDDEADALADDGGTDAAGSGSGEVDLGEGAKPAGWYVRRPSGLFPAPLPQHSEQCERVSQYFWFLGVFLAKVLQDGRLVDLPMSDSFLQLLCHNKVLAHSRSAPKKAATAAAASDAMSSSAMSDASSSAADLADLSRYFSRDFPTASAAAGSAAAMAAHRWYDGVLGADNLQEIDPIRANFLRSLQEIVLAKQTIEQDRRLTPNERLERIDALRLQTSAGPVAIDDLALTFTYLPSSRHCAFESAELVENGANIDVCLDNLEEYCECMANFCLQDGIAKQLEAFHAGFSQVFPLNKLAAFTPNEARMMICGEQHPKWTRDDLMSYTEPKLGYTKER